MKKYSKTPVKPGPMLYPLPAVMVSCGSGEDANIITIAWTGIINTNPPMTYVSVMKSRHSHSLISESGEFVINLVSEELARAVDYCGVKSGRDVDKWAELGLTKADAELVSAPLIAEAPVSLECRVTEVKELPSHDMFMAEIARVHIADDFISSDGAYDFSEMGLIAYNHGKYHSLERENLGFFGFSIMKAKTIKRKAKEARKAKVARKSKEARKAKDPRKSQEARKAKDSSKSQETRKARVGRPGSGRKGSGDAKGGRG